MELEGRNERHVTLNNPNFNQLNRQSKISKVEQLAVAASSNKQDLEKTLSSQTKAKFSMEYMSVLKFNAKISKGEMSVIVQLLIGNDA